eukprot:g2495.t1
MSDDGMKLDADDAAPVDEKPEVEKGAEGTTKAAEAVVVVANAVVVEKDKKKEVGTARARGKEDAGQFFARDIFARVTLGEILSPASATITPRIYELVKWKNAAQTLRIFAALEGLRHGDGAVAEKYLSQCFEKDASVVDKKQRRVAVDRYVKYAKMVAKAFNLRFHLKDIEQVDGDKVVGSWTLSGRNTEHVTLGGIADSKLTVGHPDSSVAEASKDASGDDNEDDEGGASKKKDDGSTSSDPWMTTLSELRNHKRAHFPKLIEYAIRSETTDSGEGAVYPFMWKTREGFKTEEKPQDFELTFAKGGGDDKPPVVAAYALGSSSIDNTIASIFEAVKKPLHKHPYFMQRVREYRTGKKMTPDEAEAFRKDNFCWVNTQTKKSGPMAPKIVGLKEIPLWSAYLTMARTRDEDDPAYFMEFQQAPGADGKNHHHIDQFRPPDRPIKDVPSRFRKVKFEHDPKMNQLVSLWQGDICTLEIDAVLNAANNEMLGGGGIDGCIHRAAGPWLVEDCRLHGIDVTTETEWGPETTVVGCQDGDAKLTRAFCLPAKYVIATVGPRIREDRFRRPILQPKALRSCYKRSLDLMKRHGLRSIALNSISTGIFGYPSNEACEIALTTVREWLAANPGSVDRIIFCTYSDEDTYTYQRMMPAYFPDRGAKKGHVVGGGGGFFGMFG